MNDKRKQSLLVLGIVLIACNLRAPITSVGPLVPTIQGDTGLSGTWTGMITTLPLLCFGLVSPFVSRLGRRFGGPQAVFGGMVATVAGLVIRSYCGVWGLYLGTLLIGSGIAVSNVLIPSIIKEDFPTRVGTMMSVYTTAMSVFAAAGSGVSVPLAAGLGLGWKNALASLLVLAVPATLLWLPQLKGGAGRQGAGGGDLFRRMLRDPLAWKITLCMGSQSLLFYAIIAWLPSILLGRGVTVEQSGGLLTAMQLVGLPAAFFIPLLADRRRDQRRIADTVTALFAVGFLGLCFGRGLWVLTPCLLCLGFAQTASLSLALSFFVCRCRGGEETAAISGMAQSAGYLLSAVGPLLFGALFDWTGSWIAPLVFYGGVILLYAYTAHQSSKDVYLLDGGAER